MLKRRTPMSRGVPTADFGVCPNIQTTASRAFSMLKSLAVGGRSGVDRMSIEPPTTGSQRVDVGSSGSGNLGLSAYDLTHCLRWFTALE